MVLILEQMSLNRIYSQDNSYYYLQATEYDAAGRISWRALGANNLAENPKLSNSFSYNTWSSQGGRLQSLKTYTTTTTLQDLSYTYDNMGNVLTILDAQNSNQKQCFSYDSLNRLTKGTTSNDSTKGCTTQLGNGNYSEDYAYDSATGNLLSKTGIVTYTYSTSHPHAVASTSANNWSFSYDNNGNMTQRSIGTTYNYAYNAENKLTDVSGGTTALFTYDGDGNRVKTVVGGTTTVFLGNYYEWTVSPHHSPFPLPLPKMGEAREVPQEIGTIRITRYSEMSPSNPLFTSKNIKLRAREFRKQSTTAEAVLWKQLRNRRLAGLKFRRQHPLGPFIADFYCAEKRLVIELDGGIHVEQPGYDQLRTERLTEYGYRVLRFTNTTVETNLEKVLNIIIKTCQEQNNNPTPLPELGEGQG